MKYFSGYKAGLLILFAGILLAGCVTTGRIQSRSQERPDAYAALSPDMRLLVDQGRIKTGMNADAVYIAWGNPGKVTESENETGKSTAWTYYGSYPQTIRVWGFDRMHYEYYPINYVSAQVVFTNGIVKRWQRFPAPGY